jgi:hypothetical protein
MAVFGGDSFYFAFDDINGTLRTLTGVRSVTGIPGNVKHARSTAVGATVEVSHALAYDMVFTVEGVYDNTADTGAREVLAAVFAEQQANPTNTYEYEYGPEGNSAGEPLHSGVAKMLSYEEPANIDDLVGFRAQFRAQTYTLGTVSE